MNFKHKIFLIKNDFLFNNRRKKYKEIIDNQFKSEDCINNINFEKRKAIVTHAYNTVPFYKKYYDNQNFNPTKLKNKSDWELVPVITKDQLKKNFKSLISRPIKKKNLHLSSTGGSTGFPIKVFHDKRFSSELLGWRMLNWWDGLPSDDIAFIYRERRETLVKRVINNIIWFPTKRLFLDASSMSIKDMQLFIREFNSIRPLILQGYVGAVEQVALYILKNNILCHSPKICWLTSSPITKVQRKTIYQAFHCDVLDQYGCGEVFWLAAECPMHEGLHVFNDYRHIDILDNNNSIQDVGILGNIAITDLENYAFPIIKYINGDQSMYYNHKCNCGLPFPLIMPIKGRTTDCIYLPDGGVIGGDYLTTIFDKYPETVEGFQIEQLEDYSLCISYIPSISVNIYELNQVIEELKFTLSFKTKNLIKIDFKSVDNISNVRGKIKFIISNVKK